MTHKVLFLHGFFNSGQCAMAEALRDCLTGELRAGGRMYAGDVVEVLCPDLPPNPYRALELIAEIVEREQIDVIVGNSCGAMYAHIIAAEYELPCLVGNPYYKMSDFLQERKGTHCYKTTRKDGNQTLVIDDTVIDAFLELEKENRVFLNAGECRSFVWGIFGEKDSLAIVTEDGVERNKHERLFLEHYSLSFHFPGGHTPSYEEAKRYHVPLVANLIKEFAYYRKKQKEGESNDDKKKRLGAEYTHEFSQFYIDKMKQLSEAKGFYRCDIEGDFRHIIYRYRPDGKDKPFYVNKDGSIMFDFVIEYHRGKPSEGIYYGCKAEILHGDMESHADELRSLWPNIFLKDYKLCNSLQLELTTILNNTFQWKNFFRCYKPTDNIWEQRYWLFWVTLCDDEDINDVAAVATKLMARTFMRYFGKEITTTPVVEQRKRGRGRPPKRIEEGYSSMTRQITHCTEAAYRKLIEKLGEDRGKRKISCYTLNEDDVSRMMRTLEEQGLIIVNNEYEKAWNLYVKHAELEKAVIDFLVEEYEKKNPYRTLGKKPHYPNMLDWFIIDKEKPADKKH